MSSRFFPCRISLTIAALRIVDCARPVVDDCQPGHDCQQHIAIHGSGHGSVIAGMQDRTVGGALLQERIQSKSKSPVGLPPLNPRPSLSSPNGLGGLPPLSHIHDREQPERLSQRYEDSPVFRDLPPTPSRDEPGHRDELPEMHPLASSFVKHHGIEVERDSSGKVLPLEHFYNVKGEKVDLPHGWVPYYHAPESEREESEKHKGRMEHWFTEGMDKEHKQLHKRLDTMDDAVFDTEEAEEDTDNMLTEYDNHMRHVGASLVKLHEMVDRLDGLRKVQFENQEDGRMEAFDLVDKQFSERAAEKQAEHHDLQMLEQGLENERAARKMAEHLQVREETELSPAPGPVVELPVNEVNELAESAPAPSPVENLVEASPQLDASHGVAEEQVRSSPSTAEPGEQVHSTASSGDIGEMPPSPID